MEKMIDRVSYLKGLADGMKLDAERDSHVLLLEMLNVMGEMAAAIDAAEKSVTALNGFVGQLDDDLADLEDVLYGDDAGALEDPEEADDAEEEEDETPSILQEGEMIRYACPHCGRELTFCAADIDLQEEFLCPHCNQPVFPELEDDEGV